MVKANHGGKARALNEGLKHIKNDIVICIDADTYLQPQALRRIVARFITDPPNTGAVRNPRFPRGQQRGAPALPNESGWAAWSGTSFATAIASGLVAGYWATERARRPELYGPLVEPHPPGHRPVTSPGWTLAYERESPASG